MKKFLLPLFAACVFAAPAIADDAVYGTSPETAKPFPVNGWFLPSLDDAPAEVWFTIKNEKAAPINWGSAPVAPDEHQIFVYLCDGGQEAFQMVAGSDSYALLPGQEYLVKITPKAPGYFCMGSGVTDMEFPADRFEGKVPFYPIDRTSRDWDSPNYMGVNNSQDPGTTVYYLYDFDYPSQLTLKTPASPADGIPAGPAFDITNVKAIHVECPGGTNIGNGLMAPYVKAGRNVIEITVSEDVTTEQYGFSIGLDGFNIFNCGNRLLYSQSMKLDTEETYPDAYYTVERYFEVPEDGTYTFTNHGAVGSILNIGRVNRLPVDPDDPYAGRPFECVWDDIVSATVGNTDACIVVEGLKKDELVLVQSDAFGVIGEGMENQPYLMVTKGDNSAVGSVAADGNSLKVTAANGVLSVESVLLASGAEVAVYDMNANKVASAKAAVGAANLNVALDVAPGVYVVVVYGKGNSESAKIVVK